MIGQIVGNYKILQALGEGGVGMVYKGVDTMLDREVAIKVLRPELASQTSVVERFRSEAVTLAKLSHPNIATLFSLFRHGNDLFMVLEFVSGESLETVIQRRGRISVEETIPIFCQALDGIGHAHQAGIIHRDIKPSNMILTEAGAIKVLDFGIARLLGSSRMTRVGNIIGTLEYMSPEQVRGEETDARSDIYGLGMMLYELLTGKLPFESENEFNLMKMQTEEMPAPPRQLNPDIPPEIEAAIMKAVAKNPADRFQNAVEFLETLLTVDIPISAVGSFGLNSLYQAKIHTRPSKPGIEKKSRESAKKFSNENAVPMPPAFEQSAETDDETREFIPEKEMDATLLLDSEQDDSPSEIKQTRLGQAGNTASVQSAVKPTVVRDFQPVENQPAVNYYENETVPASFFSKLTWIHYAAGGAVVLVLLGVISLAAIVPLIFSNKTEQPAAANTDTVKKEPEAKTESEKPAKDESAETTTAPALPTKSNETVSEILIPKDDAVIDSPATEEKTKGRTTETKNPKATVTRRENTRPSETKRDTPKSGGGKRSSPVSSSTPNLSDN